MFKLPAKTVVENIPEFPFDPLVITKLKYLQSTGDSEPVSLGEEPVIPGLREVRSAPSLAYVVAPSVKVHDSSTSLPVSFSSHEIRGKEVSFSGSVIPIKRPKLENNPYDDDEAEKKYLCSKPLAFIIVGKPNVENIRLAKKIADYWNCICIDPETCIRTEIASNSNLGLWCKDRLSQGFSLPSGLVLRIMERQVLSEQVSFRGYVLYGLPFLPVEEDDPSIDEQMDIIFSWPIKPQIFIYIMCPDDDIISKNDLLSFDINTGRYINRNIFQLEKQVRLMFSLDKRMVINEDLSDDIYKEIEEEKKNVENSYINHLVRVPAPRLREDLDQYKEKILPLIETIVSQLDPQYLIKVDGRTSPVHMFRVVKGRLDLMPVRRVYVPQKLKRGGSRASSIEEMFAEEEEGEKEEEEEEQPEKTDIGDPAEVFNDLSTTDNPGPMHKWHISPWGFQCPVDLTYGKNTIGSAGLPFRFLDKIYFLSSADAAEKFASNPRPYLLPPNPQPSCKFYIVGPPYSGKTAVALHLSKTFSGEIIQVETMLQNKEELSRRLKRDELRQTAAQEALDTMKTKLQEDYENQLEEWKSDVKQWCAQRGFEWPTPGEGGDVAEVEGEDNETVLTLTELERQELALNPDLITQYLPEHLSKPEPPSLDINMEDPFITDYVEEAVRRADEEFVPLNWEEKAPFVLEAIKDIQAERLVATLGAKFEGGWILDGLLPKTEIWEHLIDMSIVPEMIIYLYDSDTDYTFLSTKWQAFNTLPLEEFCKKYPGFMTHGKIAEVLDEPDKDEESPEIQNEQLQKYLQDVAQFTEEWTSLSETITMNPVPLEIDISQKPMTQLLQDITKSIQARYQLNAVPLTDEDREEEAAQSTFRGSASSEEAEEEEASSEKPRLGRRVGDTGRFCPVALTEHNVLWAGQENTAVKFLDKVYTFSSEEVMERFIASPWDFAPYRKPLQHLPPARICIVGPIGSGSTTVGELVALQLGLIHRDFQHLVDTVLTPAGEKPVGRKHENSSATPEDQDEDIVQKEEGEDVVAEGEGEEEGEKLGERATLKQFLAEGMPIPEKLVPCVLEPLWTSHPFTNTGFIFSGFPLHPQDLDVMKEHYFIPDVIVRLVVDDSTVSLKRVLDDYMSEWMKKYLAAKQEALKKYEVELAEWKSVRETRRQQLIDSLEQRGEDEEEGDQAGIEEQIAETLSAEFPEPTKDFENIEKPSEARERFEQDIITWFDTDNDNFETLKILAEESNIPWLNVDAAGTIESVCQEVVFHINQYKSRSPALLESTYPMSMELADRLLQSGYMFLSKFGRWCPVQVAEKKVPVQMYQPLRNMGEVCPVAHRRFIYFLAGQKNRSLFMKDPLKYINQDADLPLIPLKFAVIGPPKCGKSTLCERLATNLGIKVVSVGQSIRFVLDEMGWTELAMATEEYLRNGDVVPYYLAVGCVEAATMDTRSSTQGFVVDGFPNNVDQVKELAAMHMIPYLVISINCSLETCIQHLNTETMNYFSRPTFSPELLTYKYEQWKLAQPDNVAHLQTEYNNILMVDGEHNIWWVYTRTKEIIFPVMDSLTKYFQNIMKGKAASLDKMCVTEEEFCLRQSQYKQYCPVCLKLSNCLEYGGSRPFKEGLLQYLDKYYWVCGQHLQLFLSSPHQFVPPRNTVPLPEDLPEPVDASELDTQNVAKDGYCVVTYCENLPQKRLVKGLAQYGVQYQDQLYLFSNAECQDRFLKSPEIYLKYKIHTISTNLQSVNITNLPCMGYLEQTTCQLLHRAVTAVGMERPKYPGLSMSVSAALYIGYLLKKYNERTPPAERIMLEETHNVFLHRCQILRKMILATRKHNPFSTFSATAQASHL